LAIRESLRIHKPGEGAAARWTAYGLLAALLFYGARTLQSFLVGIPAQSERDHFLVKDLLGGPIPVVGWVVHGAFLISTAVFLGSMVGLHVFLNQPKAVDLLVETEGELRKVTWPSLRDSSASAVVVIGTVVLFGLFLAGADLLFTMVLTKGLFGIGG
jgi:preprotein translocase SecE subunit